MDDLELLNLLPLPPECRGYKGEPLCLVYVVLVIRPRVKDISFTVVWTVPVKVHPQPSSSLSVMITKTCFLSPTINEILYILLKNTK